MKGIFTEAVCSCSSRQTLIHSRWVLQGILCSAYKDDFDSSVIYILQARGSHGYISCIWRAGRKWENNNTPAIPGKWLGMPEKTLKSREEKLLMALWGYAEA